MFQGPSSPASVRVSCTTAALEAAYAALPMLGTMAANEAALMIRPEFCRFMIGATARHIRNTPPTLTSKQRSQVSSSISVIRPSPITPALLTSTSIRPNRSATSATTAVTEEVSRTSQAYARPASPASSRALVEPGQRLGADVDRDHPRSLAQKGFGDGPADAAARAGDDDDPVTEFEEHDRSLSGQLHSTAARWTGRAAR